MTNIKISELEAFGSELRRNAGGVYILDGYNGVSSVARNTSPPPLPGRSQGRLVESQSRTRPLTVCLCTILPAAATALDPIRVHAWLPPGSVETGHTHDIALNLSATRSTYECMCLASH